MNNHFNSFQFAALLPSLAPLQQLSGRSPACPLPACNTLESADGIRELVGFSGRLTSLADRTRYGHEMMATNEFQRLLLQNAAFTPPFRIVSAIPESARTLRIPNVPHSIAEELWHIVFWQDHFLRCARQEDLAYPQHAQQGWRSFDSVSDSQWQELVARFETGLNNAADMAGEARLAERYSSLEEPGSGNGPLTLLELIANLAVHNAYHLGRIVQLRQISGNWPPPGGGDTW